MVFKYFFCARVRIGYVLYNFNMRSDVRVRALRQSRQMPLDDYDNNNEPYNVSLSTSLLLFHSLSIDEET